eukprot:SAG25_NODE_12395_length_280_cov_1.430939_1_plen_93_part_11
MGVLAVASCIYLLTTTQDARDVTLFDVFVQFVLPEVLIPVVRRLFAPVLGCTFHFEHELSTCAGTACVARMPTLQCSFDDWRYTVLFVAGIVI